MTSSTLHLRAAAFSAVALMLTAPAVRAVHVYAGIVDTNGTAGLQAGDALSFVSNTTGAAVTGPSLGPQVMPPAIAGPQAGLYFSNGITFTALSNGRNWTGAAYRTASPFAAASGSLLQVEIVNVTGPAGAQFSFWDEAISTTNPAITFTIGTGITAGTGFFDLTDIALVVGDGVTTTPAPTATNNPPVDPYGHLHGRSTTVSEEGDYTVSYIIHDGSGSSLHPASAPFVVNYSAVPEPTTLALVGASCLLLGFVRRRLGRR